MNLELRGVLGVCRADHRCGRLPVALWRFRHGDVGDRVCQFHLNMWLDMADDDEIDEPAGLTWLVINKAVC